MHKKHAKDGFVAIALNLDDLKEADTMKSVDAFYAKHKVTFPALVLNETQETWMQKFNITGVPTIFVFGRDGKIAKKYPLKEDDYEVKYDKIEKLVVELLKQKAGG
jgi:peroxiredoxin